MRGKSEKWPEDFEWRGWAILKTLTVTSRPGYPEPYVTGETVAAWIRAAKKKGIRSIICLLDAELGYYSHIKQGGLLEAYRQSGLEVFHFPVPDSPIADVPESVLQQITEQFPNMPKPVLVHCSAGIDRSGQVLKRLLDVFATPPLS